MKAVINAEITPETYESIQDAVSKHGLMMVIDRARDRQQQGMSNEKIYEEAVTFLKSNLCVCAKVMAVLATTLFKKESHYEIYDKATSVLEDVYKEALENAYEEIEKGDANARARHG
jgi:hypothetical protein